MDQIYCTCSWWRDGDGRGFWRVLRSWRGISPKQNRLVEEDQLLPLSLLPAAEIAAPRLPREGSYSVNSPCPGQTQVLECLSFFLIP